MLPAILLVGLDSGRRRLWLPLPTILLWPLWLLGWVVWGVLWLFRAPWQAPLRAALMLGAGLSGLRVDVDSAKGQSVHVRIV